MKKIILLFVLLFPSIAFSQKKKGYSRLYPNYGIQSYNDKSSVLYNGNIPRNYLQPQNTIGHYWGLEYDRVTRYGLVLNAGLQYGVRRYDLRITQDVSNFDPSSVKELKGYIYSEKMKLAYNYWGYKLMAGYRKQLTRNIAIVTIGGIETKFFTNGLWHDYELRIQYLDDNGVTTHEAPLAVKMDRFGKDEDFRKRHHSIIGEVNSFDLYIGVEKEINKSVIKNIAIGIEASRNWSLWLNDGVMTMWSYQSIDQANAVTANFFDRNLSIGLRVAVGLWK